MKILLTGRNGQVGWELERLLPTLGEVVATDRATLDLADPDAIRRVVREVKPDVIVNAAAYTAVDKAEAEPELAAQINGAAPGILAEEAKRLGALLVHYSTDYVFDGSKAAPYREDDAPNPLNVYGKTKLTGERAIQAVQDRHLIIRTSWVYSVRGRNFFLNIANRARNGERLQVVSDQRGVPTSAEFIAEVTAQLVADPLSGLVNVVPTGDTTWHGFAKEIASGIQVDADVDAITSREYATRARRPSYSVLDNSKLVTMIGPKPHWQSLLDRCIAKWTPP